MKNYSFKVYLKTHEQWPIHFFAGADENSPMIKTMEQLKEYLSKHHLIYYVRQVGTNDQAEKKPMYKSQILTIVGPIQQKDSDFIQIHDVMSLSEASEKWGLKTASTLRNAIRNNRFKEKEHRKSDGTWFVTRQGMVRVYGPEFDHEYEKLIVNEIRYDEQLGEFYIRKNL